MTRIEKIGVTHTMRDLRAVIAISAGLVVGILVSYLMNDGGDIRSILLVAIFFLAAVAGQAYLRVRRLLSGQYGGDRMDAEEIIEAAEVGKV